MNPKRKYEKTTLVRSQAEIIARYNAAIAAPASRSIEANEYTRVMSFHTARQLGCNGDIEEQADWAKEYNEDIEFSSQSLLRLWEIKISMASLEDSKRFVQMYVAFKWILGHKDSDSFPGALELTHGGTLCCTSFDYIKNQLISGEWAELSAAAVAAKRAE